jgi:dipeptidyl aminopeptidase/acylaminoacyl peptidase
MMKRLLIFAAGLLFLVPAQTVLAAEDRAAPKPSIDQVMDELFAVRGFREVALAPDGQSIAWVEMLPGKAGTPAARSSIYVADLKKPGEKPRHVTAGDGTAACAEHGVAWSPDGKQLAFLSDWDKEGQLQLYVVPAAGGAARKLTSLGGFLDAPRWLPDGKQLAVLFTENAPRAAGPVQAGAPETGVIEEQVYEQRLTLVDADSGRTKPVSPADLYVYEYDWSPDGKQVALIAAHGSGDNNWYISQLYVLTTATGETRSILKPSMQIAVPRWSPDGKALAFIGGLMSDEGANGGDIYTVPVGGGEPRDLTPDLKASANWLAWQPETGQILFTELVDGCSGIATLDPATGRIRETWTGAETISAGQGLDLALSHDHKVSAVIRQSYQQPPEVWAGAAGAWRQVTHTNRGAHPAWGEVRSLHWKSDEFTVQGWLLYPRDFDPQRRYPMVVSVHGGPAWASRPHWPGTFFDLSAVAAQGSFVFCPNPRGSFGQGKAFTRANVKEFGHGDLRDILAGVDEALKAAPIDKDRLGIAGWSYGGYMTMWAVTQTTRFRSAVAGAGIANWQSYYGQNGIDQWLLPYFGASVYDDPAVYARSSPIDFIKRVKTPTLVLVGERDEECPAPQSREFWHALRTLDVPTQLVIYPGEGHLVSRPEHRRDIMRRTAAWLEDPPSQGNHSGGKQAPLRK